MSGVWGVRPAWPLVMSCPAPTEKLDTGGPEGGAATLGAEGGGGVTGETKEGTAGELDGGKGGRLVKGARVEAGGNWGGEPRRLRKAEDGGDTGGRLGDAEGSWDKGLDTPGTHRAPVNQRAGDIRRHLDQRTVGGFTCAQRRRTG